MYVLDGRTFMEPFHDDVPAAPGTYKIIGTLPVEMEGRLLYG